nr:hypothetical protein [Bacillus pumilus]
MILLHTQTYLKRGEIQAESSVIRLIYLRTFRPSQSLPGLQSLVRDVDLVIFRENTEGFYPDRNMYHGVGEWMVTPDVAISTGVFTKKR